MEANEHEKIEEESQDNEQENKEEDGKKKIYSISAGMVSAYATEYLENVFRNILNQKENIFEDTNTPEDYLVTIIAGGVSGLLDDLPTLPNVVMSTALYYGLYAAIDSLKGKEIDGEKLVKDFVIDVFFIYLLVLFYEAFQKQKDDPESFCEALAAALPLDTLISLYYAFRDYFSKESDGNDKKRLSKRGEESII
jgi:hypothetical protein